VEELERRKSNRKKDVEKDDKTRKRCMGFGSI